MSHILKICSGVFVILLAIVHACFNFGCEVIYGRVDFTLHECGNSLAGWRISDKYFSICQRNFSVLREMEVHWPFV